MLVIIDNVWRHAPDQHIAYDERRIINNVLSVSVESCGDVTCFCSNFFGTAEASAQATVDAVTRPALTSLKRSIGVAAKYVEREETRHFPFRKAYMHTEISVRPFDVTVVNVKNLSSIRGLVLEQGTEGTISRVSSFEYINPGKANARVDPNVPTVEDAAYAAVLNDQDGPLPHTAPYRAQALSGDPTELAYSVRARLSSPLFGFNEQECHRGIRLLEKNHCAVRVQERGMYKSVRGVLPVVSDHETVYFEFFVLKQSAGGGVCLGLATPELPLNCLCGTRPNSIGFCTSGSLIQTVHGKETWTAFGSDVNAGSTVGCLVSLRNLSCDEESEKTVSKATVQFLVDGISRGSVDYEFVGGLDVFPTLSMFSKHTRVYSLFNGPDMLFASCLAEDQNIVALDGRPIKRDTGNTPESLGLATLHPQSSLGNV